MFGVKDLGNKDWKERLGEVAETIASGSGFSFFVGVRDFTLWPLYPLVAGANGF